jgi:ADP-heptose:LPS heptosyltransferase
VLAHLQEAHPEYEYTVLMRKESADFKAAHPDVRVVYGDFDDLELLEREAERADVVIRACFSDFYGPGI